MLLRGCGSAGLGTAPVPPAVLLWHCGTVEQQGEGSQPVVPSKVFPSGAAGRLGVTLPGCPWGSPLQSDISAARRALVMAGEGQRRLQHSSAQSCAHFAAGSGQCQHLWCCHWPGMPLSHPGRAGAGEDGHITSSWSRFCLTWAPQGQCARQCPAVVTSGSCSGARLAQALWSCLLAHSGCPPGSVWCLAGSWGSPSPLNCLKSCGKMHLSLSELSHVLAQVLECTGGLQGRGGPWEGKLELSRSVGSEHQGVPKEPLHCRDPWGWRESGCAGAPLGSSAWGAVGSKCHCWTFLVPGTTGC